MDSKTKRKIGITCAYTPVQVIHAAGFTPYRVLPQGESPEQAGQLLHDNMCAHVKRILDRGLSQDIPDLSGMIFINSCDSMRRLAGAWKHAGLSDKITTIDLPSVKNELSISFLSKEFKRLAEKLYMWGGEEITEEKLMCSIELYNELIFQIEISKNKILANKIKGGSAKLQELYNLISVTPPEEAIETIQNLISEDNYEINKDNGVPIFLFGNVLPDIKAFELFEECGANIIKDDLCTGSRFISHVTLDVKLDIYTSLSRSILTSPPCARTFDEKNPGGLAEWILSRAKSINAKGVIGYTLKYCDPYLARLPHIRETLKKEGISMLQIEGDCSLGTIGQQKTRIEAFIEMLR